jgi:hypothetical protein
MIFWTVLKRRSMPRPVRELTKSSPAMLGKREQYLSSKLSTKSRIRRGESAKGGVWEESDPSKTGARAYLCCTCLRNSSVHFSSSAWVPTMSTGESPAAAFTDCSLSSEVKKTPQVSEK